MTTNTIQGQLSLLQESQWELESMQLVNFGPFDGYHCFDFKTGFESIPTTVIAGDSGTGKSTVEDAFFEVMTRNGSYNTASNEGGRGGSISSEKRSLIGYVRGKLEDVEDADGNPVAQMLRDGSCNRWSAVVLTFLSDNNTVFCVAKLFWIASGYSANSDVKQLRLTMYRRFDPRILEPIADASFTTERVRRILGNEVRTYARVDEFLTYVYRVLKIDELGRGKEVMDLLSKIRSGAGFKSIAELFREQVLDVPATFEKAEEAAQSYHEHWDAYEKMLDKQRRVDALTEVCGLGDEHAQLLGRLQTHQAALVPVLFDAWKNHTQCEVLRTYEAELAGQADILKRELEANNNELSRATLTQEELQRQLAASGYTQKLAAYDAAIARAEQTASSCRSAREACSKEVTPYFGKMPVTQEDFDKLQANVQEFLSNYDAVYEQKQQEQTAAMEARITLDARIKELRADMAYYEQNKSRIPRTLGEARALLASAAGMDQEALPFAAELMEVTDESWRYAIESVYSSFARTLLVAAGDFEAFSTSIDELRLKNRITFRKVEQNIECTLQSRPGYLSEKLIFAESSPFAGWLMNTVRDEHHDALRVGSAAELAGAERRVTINGQTRDGSRGAHGRDMGAEGIIGFDNSSKLEALAQELIDLNDPWQKAHEAEKRAAHELTVFVQKRSAAERIANYVFADIDLASAIDALEKVRRAKQQFLEENDQLGNLEKELREITALVTKLIKQVGSLETRFADVSQTLDALKLQLKELMSAPEHTRETDTSSDAYLLLTKTGDEYLTGHGAEDNLKSFDIIMQRIQALFTRRISEYSERLDNLSQKIEKLLADYLRTWPDSHLGTTTESLPDYKALLAKLEEEGFHTQKESWYEHMLAWIKEDLIPLDVTYRDARTEIDDRLEPINAILRTLPFGRDGGRLEIVCRSSDPKVARDFSALLRELLDYERNQQILSEEAYHNKAAQLMEIIDPTDTRAEASKRRNDVLDRRRHVTLTARVVDPQNPEKPKATYNMLASKSGGEVAEIVAFILGAALLYRLGQDGSTLPGFAPVLLDEGFIKADSRFTSRAISAWQGFGFQLIIAVPEEKYQSVVSKAERVLNIVADASRRSYVSTLDLIENPKE